LARFRAQIEGVSIGVVSLDERRNRIVEPGCPSGAERLATLARLAARGLPMVLRIDPIFPDLDDDWDHLSALVAAAERNGAWGIAAGYVFSWGRYLRRMRREPMLADACRLLTERAPMAGGPGWSVPLARKVDLYGRLARLAQSHGLYFQTCGCKDLRLHDYPERFAARCSENPFFRMPLPILAGEATAAPSRTSSDTTARS
jgi:hypothetical protein